MIESYSAKGLVEATNKNHLFDYIADHYHEMPNYDLKEVLLAVLGIWYDKCCGDEDEEALCQLIVEELADRYFGEE